MRTREDLADDIAALQTAAQKGGPPARYVNLPELVLHLWAENEALQARVAALEASALPNTLKID